jgi:hypothetical protein
MDLKQRGRIDRIKQFGIREIYPSIKGTPKEVWQMRYAELMADPYKLVQEYQDDPEKLSKKGREHSYVEINKRNLFYVEQLKRLERNISRNEKFEDIFSRKKYTRIVAIPLKEEEDQTRRHMAVLRRKPVEYFDESEVPTIFPLTKLFKRFFFPSEKYYELMDPHGVDHRDEASVFNDVRLPRFVKGKIQFTPPEVRQKFQRGLPTCALWSEFFAKHPEKTWEELISMMQEIKEEPEYQDALDDVIRANPTVSQKKIIDDFQETIMYHKLMEMEEKGPTDVSYLSPEEIVDLRGIGRRKRK